jgi:hypothetical protein
MAPSAMVSTQRRAASAAADLRHERGGTSQAATFTSTFTTSYSEGKDQPRFS